MTLVGTIDLVGLLFCLIGWAVLLASWRRFQERGIRNLIMALLAFICFHSLSNSLEWLGVTSVLDAYEDYFQIMEAMFWGLFFYAFLLLGEIARRKKAESRLRESRADLRCKNDLLECVLDSIPDPLNVQYPDHALLHCNRASNMLADVPGPAKDKRCFELLGMDMPCDPCVCTEALNSGQLTVVERFEPRLERFLEFRGMPASGTKLDGTPYLVEIIRDITERKRMEEDMIKAMEAAEAASLAKSEFLANMSHEIRTPLNGIMGMLQLMRTGDLDAEQRQYADVALISCQRLTELLSDILDLSRIEAGKLGLRKEPFDLPGVLALVMELFTPMARQQGIALELDLSPNLPRRVIGDASRLQQVLVNLVGNAVKFTPKGHVTLSAWPLNGPGSGRILFIVSDTGVGIADQDLDRMFEPFNQLESVFVRKHQGAGLGLAIVRRLVEAMGGGLCVASEPGVGTAIHFCLSMPLPDQEK